MPPGGGKHPLQFNQMKVKKGEIVNNSTSEQKEVHWIDIFTQCQLKVLFVVSYLFVSFLFPM